MVPGKTILMFLPSCIKYSDKGVNYKQWCLKLRTIYWSRNTEYNISSNTNKSEHPKNNGKRTSSATDGTQSIKSAFA